MNDRIPDKSHMSSVESPKNSEWQGNNRNAGTGTRCPGNTSDEVAETKGPASHRVEVLLGLSTRGPLSTLGWGLTMIKQEDVPERYLGAIPTDQPGTERVVFDVTCRGT